MNLVAQHRIEIPPLQIHNVGSLEEQLAGIYTRIPDSAQAMPSHMVRLSTISLIVLCPQADDLPATREAIKHLQSWHPARILLIAPHHRGRPRIEAEIALIWSNRPDTPEQQTAVCSEEITLHVYGPASHHLLSIIRPLLPPDIPVALWFSGDPSLTTWLSKDLLSLAQTCFIDSHRYSRPSYVFSRLNAARRYLAGKSLIDIAWLRVRPWRFSIARAFNLPEILNVVPLMAHIDIEIASPNAEAYLSMGWMLSCINALIKPAGQVRIPHTSFSPIDPGEPSTTQARMIITFGGGHDGRIVITETEDTLTSRVYLGHSLIHTDVLPRYRVPSMVAIGETLQHAPVEDGYLPALEAATHLAVRREGTTP